MPAASRYLAGLDIGTSLVKVVVAERVDEGKLSVTGVGMSPSRGLRKGVVVNIEATVESIAAAVKQAESMSGRQISTVFAAISGSHVKGINSHGIVGIKQREVSLADVARVIEAARAVAIPTDREILHVLPQEYILDDQDGIKEPLGISGVRLEARVHIVTGSVASAQNVVKCANRCGLSVKDIVCSSVAAGRAVLFPEESELGACVIDIGGGTTDISVVRNGAVYHTAVIPFGGNHITNDIAAGLRTPVAAAEEIKRKYGIAMVSLVGRDETIEVPSTGDHAPRVLSKVLLAEIIEPRVNEMFSLVAKELQKGNADQLVTSGVVLTGGCASLVGVNRVAEQVFNAPVRVGAARPVGGLNDLIAAPEYAAAVGLVLFGAGNAASYLGRNSSGRGVGQGVGQLVQRVSSWLSDRF